MSNIEVGPVASNAFQLDPIDIPAPSVVSRSDRDTNSICCLYEYYLVSIKSRVLFITSIIIVSAVTLGLLIWLLVTEANKVHKISCEEVSNTTFSINNCCTYNVFIYCGTPHGMITYQGWSMLRITM